MQEVKDVPITLSLALSLSAMGWIKLQGEGTYPLSFYLLSVFLSASGLPKRVKDAGHYSSPYKREKSLASHCDMNNGKQREWSVAIETSNSEKEIKCRVWCSLEGLSHPPALPGKQGPNARPPANGTRAWHGAGGCALRCLPVANWGFMGWGPQVTIELVLLSWSYFCIPTSWL